MLTSGEIRQQFIDFFCKKHGHTFVPSSSVVPLEDPTLPLRQRWHESVQGRVPRHRHTPLTNGRRTRRSASGRGGKHNDLDDVGKDTYHHTFFEMLGNWSFGDYFKKEAITWAWELLTPGVGARSKRGCMPPSSKAVPMNELPRDEEAYELWKTLTTIDPTHIHWGNKKDNFWEMGETGPCGTLHRNPYRP